MPNIISWSFLLARVLRHCFAIRKLKCLKQTRILTAVRLSLRRTKVDNIVKMMTPEILIEIREDEMHETMFLCPPWNTMDFDDEMLFALRIPTHPRKFISCNLVSLAIDTISRNTSISISENVYLQFTLMIIPYI